MSDPRRMIEPDGRSGDGELVTPLERELLGAGRSQKLTSPNKGRIWMGITAQILPPVVPGHLPGTEAGTGAAATAGLGTAKALTAASAVKGAIVIAMLGGSSLAGYHAIRSHGTGDVALKRTVAAPPRSSPARAAPPVAEPMAQTRQSQEEAVVPRATSPVVRGARDGAAARRQQPSRLAAEGSVVLEARRTLRDGDAAGALRRLEAARGEFADGALVQEREALTIEALYRDGQHDAATHRAASFLRAYPGSPHAASVRRFGGP
jgi:hypothetical protein